MRLEICADHPRLARLHAWRSRSTVSDRRDLEGRSIELGDAEIEVTGRDRIRYAAPQLIFHYIVHHEYQPPSGFVEAVLQGELVRSWASNAHREVRALYVAVSAL